MKTRNESVDRLLTRNNLYFIRFENCEKLSTYLDVQRQLKTFFLENNVLVKIFT